MLLGALLALGGVGGFGDGEEDAGEDRGGDAGAVERGGVDRRSVGGCVLGGADLAGRTDRVRGRRVAPAAQAGAGAHLAEAEKKQFLKGHEIYFRDAHCATCHQPDGKGLPPAFPALKGSKIATGAVADHLNIVVNGKAGTAMASFKQLSDTELAAVMTYTRNAWSNKAEDNIVQPKEVLAARAK